MSAKKHLIFIASLSLFVEEFHRYDQQLLGCLTRTFSL
jgi:hypothetical protein